MPIDDALEEMRKEDSSKKAKGKKVPAFSAHQPDEAIGPIKASDIMKSYIAALVHHTGEVPAFNMRQLEPYAPWVRFKKSCNSVIGPIPRDSFLEIIKDNCRFFEYHDLIDLIDQNKQWFSDPVNISSPDCFKRVPAWMSTQAVFDITGYTGVQHFEKKGQTIIMPDLNYMSMFIENGKMLRGYLTEMGYTAGKKSVLKIFNKSMMINCEELDSRNVKDKATKEAIKKINGLQKDLVEAKKDKKEISLIRRALYYCVKDYTPELVIPEPDDKNDFPELFPERRRPAIDDGDD